MRKIICLMMFITLSIPSYARIGESLTQCIKRYGKYVYSEQKDGIARYIFRKEIKDDPDSFYAIKICFPYRKGGRAIAIGYARVYESKSIETVRDNDKKFTQAIFWKIIFGDKGSQCCEVLTEQEKEVFRQANCSGKWKRVYDDKGSGWMSPDGYIKEGRSRENWTVIVYFVKEYTDLLLQTQKNKMADF